MSSLKNKKVFVGLSGGVDSSVSAALLKKEGYDVTGVFIKTWHPDFLPCTWKDERLDAMRVASHLDIPFLTFDFEKEYKKEVADYMISEYKKGRTPNPDVACNKVIKFGAFLKKAKQMGADYIATGHYVRQRQTGIKNRESRIKYELLEGVDNNKDQSYFLWTLTQDQLQNSLFPVGKYEKKEVRILAKKFELPTADKKDSQGICFLGELNMKDFLKHYIKEKIGDVVTEKGEVVGTHDGAFYYTLGQRHGFNISKKGKEDKPYFVISKDLKKNTIKVTHDLKKIGQGNSRDKKEFVLEDINWISEIPKTKSPDTVGENGENKKYKARIRYRGELLACHLEVGPPSGRIRVILEKSEPTATPGQSLVIYDGKICLGGGVIK